MYLVLELINHLIQRPFLFRQDLLQNLTSSSECFSSSSKYPAPLVQKQAQSRSQEIFDAMQQLLLHQRGDSIR